MERLITLSFKFLLEGWETNARFCIRLHASCLFLVDPTSMLERNMNSFLKRESLSAGFPECGLG